MADTEAQTVRTDPRPDAEIEADPEPVRSQPRSRPVEHVGVRKVRETKPSILTTEFWLTLGGIAALIVVYVVEDDASLDLFRTCMLATVLAVGYVLSRGLAKGGSRTTRVPEDW
jgi:hypothetical protein